MAGIADIVTSVVDQKHGPGILRSPQTAGNPIFALAGNTLGFGRGLLPNAGFSENRNDFEWEMGCLSWQQPQVIRPAQVDEAAAKASWDKQEIERFKESGGFLTPRPFPGVPAPESPPTVTPKAIKFRVNPSDVSWSMAQRSQEMKTKAGTVLHVWNDNQRKTYFDEPVLTINFQSGNILPTRSIASFRGDIPEGLCNFYEFMALVDEVKVLDDGRANLCYIQYNSLIFPSITLWGFFTPNGISFSDSAANHAQVNNWTASFTVYKSSPELGRAIATSNQSRTDGQEAGFPLKQRYMERVGFTYSNRRSETFGALQDISTTVRAVASGQVPPRDIGKAAKASVNAASQRVVARTATAIAGAASAAVSGVPSPPRTAF